MYDSERQRQILEPIRDTLVEKVWDLKSPDQIINDHGNLERVRLQIGRFAATATEDL